jgi:hypothetical protein
MDGWGGWDDGPGQDTRAAGGRRAACGLRARVCVALADRSTDRSNGSINQSINLLEDTLDRPVPHTNMRCHCVPFPSRSIDQSIDQSITQAVPSSLFWKSSTHQSTPQPTHLCPARPRPTPSRRPCPSHCPRASGAWPRRRPPPRTATVCTFCCLRGVRRRLVVDTLVRAAAGAGGTYYPLLAMMGRRGADGCWTRPTAAAPQFLWRVCVGGGGSVSVVNAWHSTLWVCDGGRRRGAHASKIGLAK